MSQFLKDTAQKETLARRKLEDFIEGLVDRAENAEQSVNQMQRYMAMSQDGLPSMGINSPISSMPPMESVPRSSLPMGPRRQVSAYTFLGDKIRIYSHLNTHTLSQKQ